MTSAAQSAPLVGSAGRMHHYSLARSLTPMWNVLLRPVCCFQIGGRQHAHVRGRQPHGQSAADDD